jgi:hypothetical protein
MKHLVWLVALAACGDNIKLAPDAAPPDSSPDAPVFAEAPHGTAPQVQSGGGPVLTAPKIVPIFFTGDSAIQTQTEQYLNALAASSYWTTATREYGVGSLTIQPTIVSSDTPPTTDAMLQAWLKSNLDGTHPTWPTFDPGTIYSVFLPDGVTLSTPFGDSCSAFGAYHDEAPGANNTKIVYALMPRCQGGIDSLTVSSSHEFVEASTDPLPTSQPAYQLVDNDHIVWEFTPGGELGDMCEYVGQAAQQLVGNFYVQRTWSNLSAAAGHDPCVPVLSTPYASAAPMLTDDASFDDGTGMPKNTKSVKIPVGMSKTIDIALYSDAPTQPWTVKAIDAAQLNGSPKELSFTWDKTMGNNGDVLHLTITRVSAGMGGSEFLISSRPTMVSDSIWFGYVSN